MKRQAHYTPDTPIILFHNHPSGNPAPSISDINETNTLRKACNEDYRHAGSAAPVVLFADKHDSNMAIFEACFTRVNERFLEDLIINWLQNGPAKGVEVRKNMGTRLKLEDGQILPLSGSATDKPQTAPDTSSSIASDKEYTAVENGYMQEMSRGETSVGAPLFVFFRVAGTMLADESQILNIEAIADLAKVQNLRIRITGAADSATGSAEKNEELAHAKAEYVDGYSKRKGYWKTISR